jgi:hypothetical protein
MRLVRLVPALLVLMASAPALAQNWFQFEDKAERFTVNFPGEPTVTDITYPSEYDGVHSAKLYKVSDGTTDYSVTVVYMPDAQVSEVRGSIAFAAHNIRERGGEIRYDAYSQIDRIEGHQLQIWNEDGTRTYVAIYLNDRRLFIVEATSPSNIPPPAHFQQSIGIFDETGRRVRFEIDANGQRSPTDRGGAYGEAPEGNADVYDIDEELEYQRELAEAEAARAAAEASTAQPAD